MYQYHGGNTADYIYSFEAENGSAEVVLMKRTWVLLLLLDFFIADLALEHFKEDPAVLSRNHCGMLDGDGGGSLRLMVAAL